MIKPDGSGVLLHVLPARPGGTEDFNDDIRIGNLNVHLFHFSHHSHSGCGSMDAPGGLGCRNTLNTVYARLVFEFRVGAFAAHLENDFLEPANADGIRVH
jgi:hypothetical protein